MYEIKNSKLNLSILLFELQKERWVAQGGKVTWEKVGLPAKETFDKFLIKNKNDYEKKKKQEHKKISEAFITIRVISHCITNCCNYACNSQ